MIQFTVLDINDQRRVAAELATFLLLFFGNETYYNELNLQKDFTRFQQSGIYEQVVEQFQNQNNVDVSFLLKSKRWKVCKVCFKPFLATDTGNKQELCRYNTYVRYTTSGKQINSAGKSVCEMIARQKASLKYASIKQQKERLFN